MMSEASYPISEFRRAGRYKPPIPVATKTTVKNRANGRCERCFARLPLELHHVHYENEGRETPDDLLAVCRNCHLREHVAPNGVFYADPQELAVEWATYDKND